MSEKPASLDMEKAIDRKNIKVQFSEGFDVNENMKKKLLKKISKEMRSERYVGEGGAAKVYSFRDGSCMKVMKNRHVASNHAQYNLGLSPYEEFRVMERAASVSVMFEFRSPTPQTVIESGNSAIIVMEELDAVTLLDVLNGKAELPEGFDYNKFEKGLADYIDSLHASGIAHGDILPRNIMIKRDGSESYVIDFGRAIFLNNDYDTRERICRQDFAKYEELCVLIDSHKIGEKKVIGEVFSNIGDIVFDGDIRIHHSKDFLSLVRTAFLSSLKVTSFTYFGKEFTVYKDTENLENIDVDFEIFIGGSKLIVGKNKIDKYIV